MNPGSTVGAYVAAYITTRRRYQTEYLSDDHQYERDTTPTNYTATGIILTASNLILIGVTAYTHMWLLTIVSAITLVVSWLACFPTSGKRTRDTHDAETLRDREQNTTKPTARIKTTRTQRQRR